MSAAAVPKIDIRKYTGLTLDSRQVREGMLFAALPGSQTDGSRFIEDAVRKGAKAVLAAAGTAQPEGLAGVEFLTDENPKKLFSQLAAAYYGAQPEHIFAVTGTNGKTSTVNFVRQIWEGLSCRSASLGTLGLQRRGETIGGSMTTPDPVSLHKMLAGLAQEGVTHLAMEASSHGLDQFRLDGVKVEAAGFTSFSRDHMDYHPTEEAYLKAKLRLFEELVTENGWAVLNADIPEYKAIREAAEHRGLKILDYGRNAESLRVEERIPESGAQKLALKIFDEQFRISFPLVGEFQTYNMLCALGLVLSQHHHDAKMIKDSVKIIEQLKGVPGRLQPVPGHPAGASVYIDYAHTPDGLENVLNALRPHTQGRLACVFGCGGDRDRGKRPLMGRAAQELADIAIVTDDNPRSEDPASIRAQILKAAPQAFEFAGREAAINHAVEMLKSGDVLVIAGKGHEQGQIFAGYTEPFCDLEKAAAAIQRLIKGKDL